MTNDSDDYEYQQERQREIEAEKVRQQRIRDKVPGRRANGKARAGDIDGQSYVIKSPSMLSLPGLVIFQTILCY